VCHLSTDTDNLSFLVVTINRQIEKIDLLDSRAKGAVGHDAGNRTFVFFPRLKEDKVKKTAAHELLERVFGGDVGSLVAHLLKNDRISRDDLDVLHRLIDQHRKD